MLQALIVPASQAHVAFNPCLFPPLITEVIFIFSGGFQMVICFVLVSEAGSHSVVQAGFDLKFF